MILKIVGTILVDQASGTSALKRVELLKLVFQQDVLQLKHIQHNAKRVLLKNATKIRRMTSSAGI